MNVEHIIEKRIFEEDDVETYGKLNANRNARVRAINYLLEYVDGMPDPRLNTMPLMYETLFDEILRYRPKIYPNDKGNDRAALINLQNVIKKYDGIYSNLMKDLAKMKYLYEVDSVRALDKFSHEIDNFVITGKMRDDIVKEIRSIRKKCNHQKNCFGKQYKSLWNGHISYADALRMSKEVENDMIFVDVLWLSQTIEWFEKIKELLKNNSMDVLKEQKQKQNKRADKMQARRYIDSQIENYYLNQELNAMRTKLVKAKIK